MRTLSGGVHLLARIERQAAETACNGRCDRVVLNLHSVFEALYPREERQARGGIERRVEV